VRREDGALDIAWWFIFGVLFLLFGLIVRLR